jgi:hypothetical protein
MTLAACFHLHCYQPPRQDPWLELIEPEPDAFPYHDCNQRVTAECYRPNTAAAVLAQDRRLHASCDNFAISSFDVVGTLHGWLAANAPDVDAAVLSGGTASGGPNGAALAAPAIHAILPLASPEDRDVLISWGVADFEARFGFPPEGMWLPETAVDVGTLADLARHDIGFTVLMPQQASRVREPGRNWVDVSGGQVDPTRPYFVTLPDGTTITVVFGHGPLSRGVAFGGLLEDGASFVRAVRAAVPATNGEDALMAIVTDGETYGHHHRFGEMALAWAARELRAEGLEVTNLGTWLQAHPPTAEVELVAPSSWSCAHGIERWRADCGCTTDSQPGWSQSWRAPLRDALDWLASRMAEPVAAGLRDLLGDHHGAVVEYGRVVTGREAPGDFVARRAGRPLTDAETTRALELLELRRHLLSAFTSCAWFFADPTGVETLLSLRHAAVVLETARGVLGVEATDEFLERLDNLRSNLDLRLKGRDLWARFVEPRRVDAATVAREFALELVAGATHRSTRRGAWAVTSRDVVIVAGRASGTVVVEHAPTLRRTLVEIQATCVGAVSAVASSRVPGEDPSRETELADAPSDVIARVGAARLTGSADADPLLALRLLTASLRTRPAEVGDAAVLGALVAAAAPLQSRDIDAVRAGLVVLRDASLSKETVVALESLGDLAEATSVEWPETGAE